MLRKFPVDHVTAECDAPAIGWGCVWSADTSAVHPPIFTYPATVIATAPTRRRTVCALSVSTTARSPPIIV